MSDVRDRLTKQLEPVLLAPDPRPAISAYHDMPYALFRYDPGLSSSYVKNHPFSPPASNKLANASPESRLLSASKKP